MRKNGPEREAISYLASNTPNSQSEVEGAIERYIVMPSQATAYKIGMLKIIQLRDKAQNGARRTV